MSLSTPLRPFFATVGLALILSAAPLSASSGLVHFRDQIERGYNARDHAAIETTISAMTTAGEASGQQDLTAYYTAFARLRQSAIPGSARTRARNDLDQCIDTLEPLLRRRKDYVQARALYASCLGASASYYVLKAATRGIASGREMAAAVKQAPDNPWVVFQDAVSDLLTPALFGGSKERALAKLKRAQQLFVASRPTGSAEPVFGESETWLYVGRVYLATGQKAEARKAWQQALLLAPESADVQDELGKL